MQFPKSKRRVLLAGIAMLVLGVASTACQPYEIAAFKAVFEQRQSLQKHPFLVCVRHHESDRDGPYPYIGGYRQPNLQGSSASGAYQFLDSTWRTVSVKAGHPGYSRAMDAPDWVQDSVAYWLYSHGGRSAWNGTNC